MTVIRDAIPLRRTRTNLRDLLASALEILDKVATSSGIELRIELASSKGREIEASVDPEKIAWAVTTLTANALRYVKPGTRRMPGGTIAVRLDTDHESGDAVIVVQDDGPGIPPEKLPKLFERSDRPHATALGLLLVKDVIAAHGGTVEVASSCDSFSHGTTITLRIPAREEGSSAPSRSSP